MVRSASRIIRMSPVAAAKPTRTASPLPLPVCCRILMPALGWPRATRWISSQVLSREWPSTKMSSVPRAHLGRALDGGLDVAGLVARGDDDGDGERLAWRAWAPRAGDDENRQAEPVAAAARASGSGAFERQPSDSGSSRRAGRQTSSQPARRRRLSTSEVASQLFCGLGRFAGPATRPSESRGRQRESEN